MTRILTALAAIAFAAVACGAEGQTVNAASCNSADVQAAINNATEGGTVTIPAGTCTWTSGVTISGKGITVTGAGSSRIVAISTTPLALVSGTQTLTVTATDPGSTLSIPVGQALTISETGTESNYMTGTVTSFTAGTGVLVMNITGSGGSCRSNSMSNCKRWLISTPAATTIVNSSATTPLFNVYEDTKVHTDISGITVKPGTTQEHVFVLNYTAGGQAILIHDCRITGNPNLSGGPDGNRDMITGSTNRGVVWNCSFDSDPFNVAAMGAVTLKDSGNATGNSWTTVSNMGSLDANGQGELFVEDNDFHAFGFANGNDDNGRMVIRYNLYDNSGLMGTHGADTSPYGQRYFEAYNNVAVFQADTDGTTFNLNDWIYMRGGTGVVYNNTLPPLVSQDYGNKPDVNMTVMNLQRNSGPDPCWGQGTTGGADYYAPRQVGMGYVTGNGKDGSGAATDSVAYAGDSEPFYIWGNNRTPLNVQISDYGPGSSNSCTGTLDSSSNYIVLNRDYFNGTTAKPGWSPYTYPHPLRGSAGKSSPVTPTNLHGTIVTN